MSLLSLFFLISYVHVTKFSYNFAQWSVKNTINLRAGVTGITLKRIHVLSASDNSFDQRLLRQPDYLLYGVIKLGWSLLSRFPSYCIPMIDRTEPSDKLQRIFSGRNGNRFFPSTKESSFSSRFFFFIRSTYNVTNR